MPTMPDSGAIENAIIAKLAADAALVALLPDGVWNDVAPQAATRFAIVSLLDELDVATFGGRAYEDALVLVKAVIKGTSGKEAGQAATRIDTLLEDAQLAAAGFSWITVHREQRIRKVEIDSFDAALRWQHRGGNYRVQYAVGTTS